MTGIYASYLSSTGGGGSGFTPANLTDVGTDGIVITGGTNAVNGLGTQIAQHVADASHNGYLSSANWTTFNNKQAALSFGNLTDAGTDGITVTGGTGAVIGSGTAISQHVASASFNGYLSSTDWSTFNSKQATVSIGAFGSTPNANGLDLTGATLSMEPADATHPGGVSTTTQTFAGNKSFIRGLAIGGTSDEVQLTVQGNSSQTNNLIQFYTSGFGDLGHLDNSGNFRVTGSIGSSGGGSVIGGAYFGSSGGSATTGLYNLTHADTIAFRNQLNSGDLTLGVNSSNVFTFSSSIGATNFSGTSSGTNTGDQTISLTGDVTASGGTGALTTAYAGTVPINKGGSGQTTKAAAFDALAPTSAKGDLIVYSSTNTNLTVGSDGQVLTADVASTPGVKWATLTSNLDNSQQYVNGSIATSVGSNALTIALKDKGGSDASSGSPVSISFRNATSATGTFLTRSVTGALSVVVSSGSTLGQRSSVVEYFYVYALDNSGTVELAVSTKLYDEGSIVTTTAEGGAGAADSRTAIYSTTARSNVPIRVICRLQSNQTTAGTWAANMTEISNVPFNRDLYAYFTNWVTYTPTLTGSGGNPTRASSNTETTYWRRVGPNMEIMYSYAQTSSSGAASGTGTYLWTIPTGFTIDTTVLQASTDTTRAALGAVGVASFQNGSDGWTGYSRVWDSTHIALVIGNHTVSPQNAGSGNGGFGATNVVQYSWRVSIPISEFSV